MKTCRRLVVGVAVAIAALGVTAAVAAAPSIAFHDAATIGHSVAPANKLNNPPTVPESAIA